MPDVGVLNLQIHDNSSLAADGLDRLVVKLGQMKDATTGMKLGTVATGIKRINDELSKVQPSAIYKLKQLADVLEKISSISGNVGGIRISFGGKGQSAEEINASMQAAREAAAQTSSMFEDIGHRLQEDAEGVRGFAGEVEKLNNLVQQTGWTAQATAEQFAQMFQVMNSIRMSGALGGGASPLALGDGTGGSGADWTYWKDGAIEVEGTVTDAMESIRIGAGEAIPLLTGVVEATSEISASMQDAADGGEQFGNAAAEFEAVKESVRETTSALNEYDEAIEFARKWNASGVSASAYNGQEAADIEYVNNLIQSASQADLLSMRIAALRDKLYQMAGSGKYTGDQIARMVSQIQSLQEKLDGLGDTADDAKKSFSEIMVGANGLDGAIKRMFPTIIGLIGRFKQLVKYRMLRAIIKQIAEGFKVGYENYYRYSEAVGGSFAPAMDSAASALLQMKNSIGAAVAPLMQSLVPVLQTVVNWFIECVNWANQLFALLRGQSTWSRAVPTTKKAFEETKKGASGASKAMKDLLADWDELNIIQSESGGGGGGSGASAAADYASMFEEVGKFDDSVREVVDYIRDNIGLIKKMIPIIGAGILGWKVSKAFGGVLGQLGRLAAGLSSLIIGVEFSFDFGRKLGLGKELSTGDIVQGIVGVLAAGIGGKLIATALGGSGALGFGIGVGVAIIASLIGYIDGQADRADKMRWGNLNLTKEEIENYVRSQFDFDIVAEIEILDANITGMEKAKKKATDSVRTLNQTFKTTQIKMKLGLDVSEPEKTALYQSAQNAITDVNAMIHDNNVALQTTLSISPIRDSEGKDISDQVLENITFADTTMKGYMTNLGTEMAKAYKQGELNEWKNPDDWEHVMAIVERQRRIFGKAEEYSNEQAFNFALDSNLSTMTRDNVQDVMKRENELINEEKNKFYKNWNTTGENYAWQAGLAKGMLEDAISQNADDSVINALTESYTTNKSLADYYSDPKNVEEAWNKKIEASTERMRGKWIDALKKVYGPDSNMGNMLGFDVGNITFESSKTLFDYLPTYKSPEQGLYNELVNAAKNGDAQKAAEAIKQYFIDAMKTTGYTDIAEAAGDSFSFSFWDLMDPGSQKDFESLVRKTFGNEKAMEIFKLAGIDDSYFTEQINSELERMFSEKLFDEDALVELNQLRLIYGPDLVDKAVNEFGWDLHDSFGLKREDDGFAVDTSDTFYVHANAEPVLDVPDTGVEFVGFDFDVETGSLVVPVDVEPNFDNAKKAVEEAMKDEIMDPSESFAIMIHFGPTVFDDALKELQYNLDDSGRNIGMAMPTGRLAQPVQMTAMGPGSTALAGFSGSTNDNAQAQDNVSRGVETGIERTRGDLVSELQTVAGLLRQILSKPNVAVVNASSALGHTVQQSVDAFARVTG